MLKKLNTQQLTDHVRKLDKQISRVKIESHLVWNTDQVKEVIDRCDSKNEIIKVEITHGFEPGRKCYTVIIWKYGDLDE